MNDFMIFSIVLAGILLAISVLLNELMAIFIVCILVCLYVDIKEKNSKPPKDQGKA